MEIFSDLMVENVILIFINFISMNIIGKMAFNSFGFNHKNHINFLLKINSIIHSIYIVYISINVLQNNIQETRLLEGIEFTKAYLVVDMWLMIWYHKYIPGFTLSMLHHISFFFSLYSPLITSHTYFVAKALMSEITNIFLYFGWFLMKKRMDNTVIFIANGVILITLFFFYRVLNFTNLFIISLSTSKQKNNIDTEKETIVMLILALMNTYWFVKLVEKFIKTLLVILNN